MFPSRGSKIAIYAMTRRMALEQWERPAAERSFKRRFADFHYWVFVFLFGTIRDHVSCYTCERGWVAGSETNRVSTLQSSEWESRPINVWKVASWDVDGRLTIWFCDSMNVTLPCIFLVSYNKVSQGLKSPQIRSCKMILSDCFSTSSPIRSDL